LVVAQRRLGSNAPPARCNDYWPSNAASADFVDAYEFKVGRLREFFAAGAAIINWHFQMVLENAQFR
jgi:hypothetical protein